MIKYIIFVIFISAWQPMVSWAAHSEESTARDLYQSIRCVTCEGQALSESNAPLAIQLKAYIAQALSENTPTEVIKENLVNRYGEHILLEPKWLPHNYLLWVLPFFVLLITIARVIFSLKFNISVDK